MIALLALLACGEEPQDSAPEGDTDTDADTDSDTDTDREALSGREGTGSLLEGGYTGTESLFFIAEQGGGESLCVIDYQLTAGSLLDDCADCDWAIEASISEASLNTEADPGCEAFGIADPSALNGQTLRFGYQHEYLGHGDVLMAPVEDRWTAVAWADYDPDTGAFSYRWEDGFVGY